LRSTVVLATTTALVAAGALSAQAGPKQPSSGDIASGLVGPLGLAVGSDGTTYVAESFAGQLTAIDRQGRREVLVEGRGSLNGVDARGKGTVVFVASAPGQDPSAPPVGQPVTTLERVLPNGKTRVVARLDDFETRVNPDQVHTYGFFGVTPSCAAQLPQDVVPGGGQPYAGDLNSNPYAVVIAPGGYYVADAGGNSVLHVSPSGTVSTVAVLPPQPPLLVTAQVREGFNQALAAEGVDARLPECVIGASYVGEPVPTDVELGQDGMLYVTSLPGFPESPGTGSVYRIDPRVAGGNPQLVYGGFTGATDLAVSPDGTVYVAELFGGRVSRATADGPVTVAELPLPAAVEWSGGQLFVAYDVFPGAMGPNGKVAVLTP
jgi:hypothetical protein